MKYRIRILVVLEFAVFLALVWHDFRPILLPAGTTGPQIVIIFILLLILEEVLRVRARLDE